MTVVCSWCRATLRGDAAARVSHGICAACAATWADIADRCAALSTPAGSPGPSDRMVAETPSQPGDPPGPLPQQDFGPAPHRASRPCAGDADLLSTPAVGGLGGAHASPRPAELLPSSARGRGRDTTDAERARERALTGPRETAYATS